MIQVYGQTCCATRASWLKDKPQRVVFQGVHMLMGGDLGRPWGATRAASVMVFIGRKLPKDVFMQGLEQCLVESTVKKPPCGRRQARNSSPRRGRCKMPE